MSKVEKGFFVPLCNKYIQSLYVKLTYVSVRGINQRIVLLLTLVDVSSNIKHLSTKLIS